MIKVSDFIIKFIEELGVKHVFTLSGGGCIHLIDSLSKSNIKYVCNLHEQAAGIAAEAYSQYSGFGVALVTTGPGSTNIITPIAGAWFDSIPMLILCGQVNTYDRINNRGVRQFGYQEIDMVSLCKSITKYAYTVIDAQEIKYQLQKAYFLAKEGRPGPVVLEIPLNIQSAIIDEEKLESFENKFLFCNSLITSNTDNSPKIKELIENLKLSKKPIILAGNGIRSAGAIEEFKKFIEKIQIPTLLTWKAIDYLEENHPLYVGRPGTYGQYGANLNQQDADFILCIGARLDHGQIAYQIKNFCPNAIRYIVDIDENEISKFDNYFNKVNCDALCFLKTLNNFDLKKVNSDWLKLCRNRYLQHPPDNKIEKKVNIYRFIEKLSELLPKNSLIVPGSSGSCSELTMQAIKLKKGTRVFNTQGLGSMGYGLSAAIGGYLASNKLTICIEGDGGFFMNIQELEVVRRLNLPIKIFILNNNGYGAIRNTQNSLFNGNLAASDDSCGLTLPNIRKQAKAYNIKYIQIKENLEINKKLKLILSEKKSIICEILMSKKHKTLPKVKVEKNKEGNFEALSMENMIF